MKAYAAKLAALGLVEVSTGGGCTALETRTPEGGRVLITTDEAQAPDSLQAKGLTLGWYNDKDENIGFVCFAGTLADIQSIG